jgi:hypothetical protein
MPKSLKKVLRRSGMKDQAGAYGMLEQSTISEIISSRRCSEEPFAPLHFDSSCINRNIRDLELQRTEKERIRLAVFKMVSEAMVLGGAGSLLCDALLRAFSQDRFEFLSLAGLTILILGVNLNLRVERLKSNQRRKPNMSVTSEEAMQDEALIELLLQQQPQAQALLERLQTRYGGKSAYGAFAPVKDERCGACNLAIAAARLQRAKAGVVIACANCSRFLYYTTDEGDAEHSSE